MAKVAKTSTARKMRPALTPEARENQLINLATDVAERQLREGTASSQVITHYLKLGTIKARYELEKLMAENELTKAKTSAVKSGEHDNETYLKVIDAIRDYRGQRREDDYEDYGDYED